MAGTPSGLTNQSLEMILKQALSAPLYRDAAAMLAVAFEIRKSMVLYKNEAITDATIIDEIKHVYSEFVTVTDPHLAHQLQAQAAQKRTP